MGQGIVCQVIDRKEDTNTGKANLTLLDTDFVGAALQVGDDPNYPSPPNISNLDYLEPGTILSNQMLDGIRQVQVYQYDDPSSDFDIKNAIDLTNVEVARYGSRVSVSPFNFISDINASWYPTLNPDSHNVGASADYDILKEYAENAKKLYGFHKEHQDYCETLRSQLAEWSKTNSSYSSNVDKYKITLNGLGFNYGLQITQNEYSYTASLSGNTITVGNLNNTPIDDIGTLIVKVLINPSPAVFAVVTMHISRISIDNDSYFDIDTTVTGEGGTTGVGKGSESYTRLGNAASHFDAPVGIITLDYLQTRVFP